MPILLAIETTPATIPNACPMTLLHFQQLTQHWLLTLLALVFCAQPLTLPKRHCGCIDKTGAAQVQQTRCCGSSEFATCKCQGGCKCSANEQPVPDPISLPPVDSTDLVLVFEVNFFVTVSAEDSFGAPIRFNPIGVLPGRSALQTCILLERFLC